MSRVANILHSVILHSKQLVRERIYCPYCGARNTANDIVCNKCKKKLPSAEDLKQQSPQAA